MGSSMKKKRDKKKDFQKPKLRVGKAKAKSDNFTDTSFKAKTITVNKQSLSTVPKTQTAQFEHYLSLATSSHSDTQRRDALSFLANHMTSREVNTPAVLSAAVMLPKLLPLILDGSSSVRSHMLVLLRLFPPKDVEPQAESALRYVRAGMTHLAAEIRADGLSMLEWLLDAAPDDAVSCAGGWIKTLKCFMSLLGWTISTETKGWTSLQKGSTDKTFPRQISVLSKFIAAGLLEVVVEEEPYVGFGFFRTETRHIQLPNYSNAFAHLNLFAKPMDGDEEAQMLADRDGRQEAYSKRFAKGIEKGIAAAKKAAGEAGREAATLSKVVEKGMADYEG